MLNISQQVWILSVHIYSNYHSVCWLFGFEKKNKEDIEAKEKTSGFVINIY